MTSVASSARSAPRAASGAGGAKDSLLSAVRALLPRVRAAGDEIEAARCIPDDLMDALHDAGVFRMSIPEAYGGPEIDPVTQAIVMEELSEADASVGWNAMIGTTVGWMSARLEAEAAKRLFSGKNALLAGQVAPRGKAEIVSGGYRVGGRWSFGSAGRHATVFMAGCLVVEGGKTKRDAQNRAQTIVALVRAKDVRVIDTWHTIGLRGSGSNDYAVEDLFVPADETFDLFAPPVVDRPLYGYPLFFTANHVGMPLGLARRAIDSVIELSKTKVMTTRKLLREEGQVQAGVGRSEAEYQSARAYAHATIEDLWRTLSNGAPLSERQRALYRLMLVNVHHAGKTIVARMFDIAGTSAIFQSHPLDRLMRDVLVVCQHVVAQEKIYRPAGRMLLDLPAGDPFF